MKSWPLERFIDMNVVFVGADKGRAMGGVERFLRQHVDIKSFIGVDKRNGQVRPFGFLEDYDESRTVFIKNEAIPGYELDVPYVTPLQLFFKLVSLIDAKTIGITGTKGKSTTSALTAHILKNAGKQVVLAGNIGISPLDALDDATAETIFVLELSSYQLADLHVSPHISACINLYHDHVDWHGSNDAYWESKRNIMRYAGSNDYFIYNPDFSILQIWASEASCRTVPIDPKAQLDLSRAQLFGDHNRLNALVARQIARELNVADEISQMAINSFRPLAHRMQILETKTDHVFIDDAIGMTPEATSATLLAVTEKFGPIGCVLLGGQNREYDFNNLGGLLARLKIPNLVLFPDTVKDIKNAFPDSYTPQLFETNSMREAVGWAANVAPENSVVLLSTAAPSYSLWQDFEDKGNQFQAAVNTLA